MKLFISTIFAASLIVTLAPPASMHAAAESDPVRVVSTFSILSDFIEVVGGEHVDVSTLVSSNADAHSFEPSPEQVITLADADVIVQNGVEFEPWLDDMIESSQTDALIVVAADDVPLRSAGEDEAHQHPIEEDDHGEHDPHIWQDVSNVVIMVENIRDGLIDVDPENQAAYEANAAAYVAELEALDAWIMKEVSTLPEARRKLVTSHDTFGYYAARYGFEVIGSPVSISAEQAEPSAKEVSELIDIIQQSGVPAIFTEKAGNTGLMEQIAESAGVELAPPLYTDALGESGSPGETYLGMMRYNTETIVAALNG